MFSFPAMKYLLIAFLLALFAPIGSCADFMLGVDANYSLEMEAKGAHWKWNGEEQELFAGMQKQGVRWLRVRLWTGDEGVNGKAYATQIVERATKAGLTPYLVIFLSEDWADMTKQLA